MELDIDYPVAEVFTPLLGDARYLGAHGGRGSGKSHFFCGKLGRQALTTQVRAVCIRQVQKDIDQSVKKLLEDQIKDVQHQLDVHGLRHTANFKFRDTWIEGPNDSYFIFQGMQDHTAKSIKSLEGYNRAFIEEAQDLTQKSMDLLRPTIRMEGSQIWAAWNPNSPDDPIEKLLRGPQSVKNKIVVEANYVHNPWFTSVLREEMEYDRQHDEEKYKHVWMGEYLLHSQARVFNNWSVAPFDLPDTPVIWRFGGDWGYAVDPTVLIMFFVLGSTLFIWDEAYKVNCRIEKMADLFDAVGAGVKGDGGKPIARTRPIVADSARPDLIDYMKRNGYPLIKPAKKGQGSVEDGIEFLKNYKIVVHPRCKHTIDELKLYSWKVDPKTEKVLPILVDKNNHVIDGLRYGVEGLRMGTYTLAGV